MFVYQEGKLYVQDGDKIVGVEIYSDKIVKTDEIAKISPEAKFYTPFEVQCKFKPIEYIEQTELETETQETETEVPTESGVEENVTINETKKPVGRPKRNR